MNKTYSSTYIITLGLITLYVFVFLYRVLYSPGQDFQVMSYLILPIFLLNILTVEYFVKKHPEIQPSLLKYIFFTGIGFIFIGWIVVPQYLVDGGNIMEDKDNILPLSTMFTSYFLISWFVVSKIKVNSDE
jgi:hypothetical protein